MSRQTGAAPSAASGSLLALQHLVGIVLTFVALALVADAVFRSDPEGVELIVLFVFMGWRVGLVPAGLAATPLPLHRMSR